MPQLQAQHGQILQPLPHFLCHRFRKRLQRPIRALQNLLRLFVVPHKELDQPVKLPDVAEMFFHHVVLVVDRALLLLLLVLMLLLVLIRVLFRGPRHKVAVHPADKILRHLKFLQLEKVFPLQAEKIIDVRV